MNLKDLKRLRLLLDFIISRDPDYSGPHLNLKGSVNFSSLQAAPATENECVYFSGFPGP